MATATYVGEGKTVIYKATKDVAYHDVVTLEGRCGVALMDIPKSSEGTVAVTGAFEIPKASGAVKLGAAVYFNVDNGTVSGTNTDVPCGFALEAADASAPTLLVKIG